MKKTKGNFSLRELQTMTGGNGSVHSLPNTLNFFLIKYLKAGSEICSIPINIHRILKFGFRYQTVNDLYPNWILLHDIGLPIALNTTTLPS